jgi:hypothetical protein
MEKKIAKCDDCGKESEYFDNEAEVMYHPEPGKKLCAVCFSRELDKVKDLWIQGHPCPFKKEGHKEIVDMACSMEAQEAKIKRDGDIYFYSDPRTVCKLMPFNPRLDTCVGEKICPVYNGGMK